jgi:hypothetical protein
MRRAEHTHLENFELIQIAARRHHVPVRFFAGVENCLENFICRPCKHCGRKKSSRRELIEINQPDK